MHQLHYFSPVLSSIPLLFLCFLVTFTACIHGQTYVTGDVSVNCGSTGVSAADRNGREWVGDRHTKFTSWLQIKGISTVSTVVRSSISDDPIPYRTARISRSAFSYSFLVNPGPKFIRFHFHPTPYKGFKRLKDFFTVEAGPFILLTNFSASITADALGLSSFTKEFCINTEENQPLNITFSPAISQQSHDTYAFINGIEIIPVPFGHSYFHGVDAGVQVVGQQYQQVYIDGSTALEMVHRLNMKRGFSVLSRDDMFGMWTTVPKGKKSLINNTTWKISVDVGFRYMVRLHFSELGLRSIAEADSMISKVLINEVVANANIDVVKEKDNNNVVVTYRDYMVTVKGRKEEGKRDLSISLQSQDAFMDGHGGPLTGFEVFKLSNTDNSLASPNPLPPARDSPSCTIQTLLSIIGPRNAIATVAITIFALLNIIVHKLREIWEAIGTEEENKPSARAERFCRRFSLAELQLATRNFSDLRVIGKGGFGRVYKGFIDNGRETVAIKRLKPNSSQGAQEFLEEIETLSELRHINIVSLIGYCNEKREMILVYEYMASGTLADHLYKLARKGNNCSSLTWKQRLNICIGAGRGLDYLHTGQAIIHRDVKVSNILLDENFTAKVSDFGLVKHENISNLQSHVSTIVKGTFGYLDPNYFSTGRLTRQSDTYAFGVVLLEVLCGRPALDPKVATDEQILTKWARDKISKGEVDLIVASSLRGEISPDSQKAFVEVVERCLDDQPKKRPTMAQVVLQLEFALEQQQTTISLVPNDTTRVAAPCNDEINSFVIEEPIMVSTEEKTSTPSPRERTNHNMNGADPPSGRRDGRKSTMYKSPRFWWDALWNRVKPFKKNEFSIAGVKLHKFDWKTISSATNQFSSSNIIGHGAYGSVFYKGEFPTELVCTVERLRPYKFSRDQALNEFENEILLLQNLQHRNIVVLIGYCIHEEEMILLYEFMDNRSLDRFISGEVQCSQLVWTQRFKIIMGIARGIKYLHQDSGLFIVHLQLTLRNILLDIDMNPKISCFNMAKTLEPHQYELTTSKIMGCHGYMSPEYCIYGKVSVMADVYSFGVVVLEIVTGRRDLKFEIAHRESLIDNAWKLWNEEKALDLVDKSILVPADEEEEVVRCIKVGLLCTRCEPHHRPTMDSVIKILEGQLSMELQQTKKTEDNLHGLELDLDEVATFEYDVTMER